MIKNISYVFVLLVSAILYFNVPSILFYLIAIIVTFALYFYNLKFLRRFAQLIIWKKILSILFIIVSIVIVFIFYFIAHGYQNLCTVGANIKAANYFTGEVKNFYCGITPWYYQELPGQDKSIFPVVKKNSIIVTPTSTLETTNKTYEIGKTYKMMWQNDSGKTPAIVSVEYLTKDGQSFGYHTLATSSISSAKIGSIDVNMSTWFIPKYNYRLVVFGNTREILYESPELFTVIDNRPFTVLVAGGDNIKINKSHVFEFGKPFTISGNIINDASSTPVFSSGVELAKNFAQVSIIKFSEDACEVLSAYDAPICNFKGEQAVTLRITAVMSDNTSYWITNRNKSLTPIGARISRLERTGNNYEIELVSMDIQKKEATIIVRPINI